MSKFKVGQKVRCIDNSGAPLNFVEGSIYTVSRVGPPLPVYGCIIEVEGGESGMFESRFEPIKDTKPRTPAITTIKVDFINPPIPVRHFDYCAHLDDEEGTTGWGKTPIEAVEHLLQNLKDALK